MKIGYILLIYLFINMTINSQVNSRYIKDLDNSKYDIKYLIYKISEQNEEIIYFLEKADRLEEQIYKLRENRKKYVLKKDVPHLIKLILMEYNKSLENKKNKETVKNLLPKEYKEIEDVDQISQKKDDDIHNYNEALNLFKEYKYILSEKYFKQSIKNGYKITLSLFYLGEIFFIRGLYKQAFLYFKKSIKVSKDKYNISFIPNTIYLHIGISLYKLGIKDKAKNFFKYVIQNFPNSKLEKEAYIFLKKI